MSLARCALSCSSGSRETAYRRTFVSTNRTAVDLVAVETVAGAEADDLILHLSLLGLEAGELAVLLGERLQVLGNEPADRAPALGSADPRLAVDVVGHGDRDVLHGLTVSQHHRNCDVHGASRRGSITEGEALVVGPRHVLRPALGREVAVASEGAEPVARVVFAHDEEAVGLLDDGEPIAHRRRPPTVTTTSSRRTSTGYRRS